MISFENSQYIEDQQKYTETVALEHIRPVARYFDDHEHEEPWDFINFIWNEGRKTLKILAPGEETFEEYFMLQMHINEMISWGDMGFYMCLPYPSLGGTAITSTGTEGQKNRLIERFKGDKPTWTAMALTESHCGSDAMAIRARAAQDGDSWVLNGEKLFVTNARKSLVDSEGFLVVWATTDPSAGHKGIKPFLVEFGAPGVKIMKLEDKLGLRSSDTAVVLLEDCRVPFENLLGGPDGTGFKGAMKTFDSARPVIAACGCGIARATLDFLKEKLADEGVKIRYGLPRNLMTSLERDIVDMDAQLSAAWLLVIKSAWLVDQDKPNTVESSMAKAKVGDVATRITQKGVELLGSLGYSKKTLVEKWMRDGRIIDIFEGTGEINRLVIARRILEYSGRELK